MQKAKCKMKKGGPANDEGEGGESKPAVTAAEQRPGKQTQRREGGS